MESVSWAEKWEDVAKLRRRVLKRGKLLLWPSKEATGVACLRGIGMNRMVLEIVAEDWCERCGDSKKTLSLSTCCSQAHNAYFHITNLTCATCMQTGSIFVMRNMQTNNFHATPFAGGTLF